MRTDNIGDRIACDLDLTEDALAEGVEYFGCRRGYGRTIHILRNTAARDADAARGE